MPVKKVKKATKKVASKKVTKKSKLVCEHCGLILTVDEECGCVGVCDVICCGEQMKKK